MNRRPMVLASLILFGTALLILTVAASIHPQAATAHPAPVVNQSAGYAPLYTASSVWTNVPITNTGLDGTILKAVTVDWAGTVWAVGYSGPIMVIISSTNEGASWFPFTQTLGTSSQLYGVAAVAPNNIFAVGYYTPSSNQETRTLVMHYNGSSWSQVSSASFSGYESRLLAVAATPGGDVWAVGHKQDRLSGGLYTLAERWDSTTGTFVTPPTNPTSPYSSDLLYGVALSGANDVWVVGEASTRGLIEHWNGTSWIYTTYRPDSRAQDSFHAIALDPNGNARVVGSHQLSTVYPLFTRWTLNSNGTAIVAASNPFTDTRLSGNNYLYGIAVTTTNDAWVAGTFTLTEHYDGLSWEVVPAEQVGSIQQTLYGVTVDPVHDGAWAVGYYTNGGNFLPLVERYARPTTPPPPKHTVSYYVKDPGSLKAQGVRAKLGITAGIVILAFGKPAALNNVSGTILPDDQPIGTFYPIDKIVSVVEDFADSYYNTPQLSGVPQPITIAVGTSNLQLASTDVMADAGRAFDHGKVWAQMINQINTYVYTQGHGSLIKIAGGSDMEIGWNDPEKTIAWANGYNSATSRLYYNFGDCAGCPYDMTSTWAYTDVFTVSWGISTAVPLPQIYRTDAGQARQWQQVDVLTRNLGSYGHMRFAGSLTEKGACITHPCDPSLLNPPATGWTQLWQALNYDPTGQTAQGLEWSSDITYNYP